MSAREVIDGLTVVPKVVVYVFRQDDYVLTFTQRDHSDAGMQVPAGTVEPGEHPDDAAVRELAEETGFAGESRLRYFAESYADVREFKPEIHRRSWYFTSARGFPNESWTHSEPRRAPLADIIAEYRWTPVADAVEALIAGQQDQLLLAHRLWKLWRA